MEVPTVLPDLAGHWTAIVSLVVFGVAYVAVAAEERLQLRKSQPVLLAAGVIWLLVGVAYGQRGLALEAEALAKHTILEFAELFLFLIAAMTYVNTMEDRGVFDALRAWLVGRQFSFCQLFWITGALAFVISPIADNLTTALLMGAVAVAVGQGRPRFITLACINIVVAANAGGAFSPFGDITTLMVWQAGHVEFFEFFALLLPSVVNWLVPAAIMSLGVERARPAALEEVPELHEGAVTVVVLFLGTIVLTVAFHNFLSLPPALGMMAGLGVLKMYAYYVAQRGRLQARQADGDSDAVADLDEVFAADEMAAERPARGAVKPLDIFKHLERVEWDTLIFFYGVLLGVGGLGAFGLLEVTSRSVYVGLGPTTANVLVGLLSAVVDNVPVMFAVLSMHPEMSHGQWLLVTLTAGVGGSLLSIGSAAGVALMGQARGVYTFGAHLRWAGVIALGYAASIATHLLLNARLF
jgi:Na+/H+ antiporter NhaD/arsenite permease-like protein